MEHVGVDLTVTGSVLTRAQLEEQRRKRGECITCGHKCFQKKLFKMIPITEPGRVLNGRCLECKPLDASQANVVVPAFVRRTTQEDLMRFNQSQSRLSGPGMRPSYNQSLLGPINHGRRGSETNMRSWPIPPPPQTSPGTPQPTSYVRAQSAPMGIPSPGVPSPGVPSPRNQINSVVTAVETNARTRDGAPARTAAAKRGMSMSAIAANQVKTSLPSDQLTAEVAWSDDILYESQSNRSMDSAGGRSANSLPHNFTPERVGHNEERNPLAGVASMPPPDEYEYLESDIVSPAYQQTVTNPVYQAPVEPTPSRAVGNRKAPPELAVAAADAIPTPDHSVTAESDEYHKMPPNHGILNRGGAVSFSKLKSVTVHDQKHAESNGTLSVSSGPDEDYKAASGGKQSPPVYQRKKAPQKHAHFADEGFLEEDGFGLENENVVNRTFSRKTYPAVATAEEAPAPRKTTGLSQRNFLVEEAEQRALDKLQNAGSDYKCRIKLMKHHPASASIQQEAMSGLSTLELESWDYEEIAKLGGLDACVMGMRSHPHQADVQIHGCRAMWNLSLTTSNQVGLYEAGALDCIVTAMLGFSDNAEVQENALAVISNLCAAQENHASILENGTVEKIVTTMNKHSEDPTVQSQGCAVITNLAAFDAAVKRTMMESGAGGAVVISLIMHPEDVKLQEEALHSLRSLCDTCFENIVEMGDVGGIDAAITAMQVHRDEPGVQEAGAWALSTLAVHPENQENIGDCGGIDVLVRAMWVHSDILGVQNWCCSALWKLTEDEQNRALVVEVGGISALVNAMQAYVDEASVQEKALGVLTNLAMDGYESKSRIVEEEAMDAIVMAMVLHSDNGGVQQEACKALHLLAIEPNLDRMRAANVAELARAAGEKFPMECGDKSSRLLEIL